PGNVRELRNCLERAVVESGGADLEVAPLKAALPRPTIIERSVGTGESDLPPLASAVATLESTLMRRALALSENDKTIAANLLGMPRSTFYHKMKEHNL
ncbi:sigma-54-dependent Fis family transcriptional regulator, partial [Mesorhizobium sp. M4A.F.Ca.ET.029.04.2.1]